jgi:tripartite-type tricarboxylate transporter receptor subunit TctC
MKRRGLLAFSACLAAPSIVRAQKPYPSAPVTIVVGLSPGGSVDATIRFMAREASEQLGVQVIVENRPGGAQTIAPARVAHGPKDGYTLVAVTYTPYTTAPFFQSLPYNVDKDFTFIGQYATVLYPNYVMSESPLKTWADALEYARSKPETLSWASATPLSPQQAANEAAFKMLGLKTIFVPFKGGAEALTSLMGGHVDMIVTADYGPMLSSGRVRLLSEQGPTRAPGMENIPSFGELGYPYTVRTGYGLAGPANLPADVVQVWTQFLQKLSGNAEWRKLLDTYNFIPELVLGEKFRNQILESRDQFGKILPSLDFKP